MRSSVLCDSGIMGRSKHLTFEEKVKIKAYHDAGLSNREIGRKLHRAHTAVGNFLKTGEKRDRVEKRGKKSKLSAMDIRRIRRTAVNQKRTASQIRAELDLPVTTRRVQQVLSNSENLEWRKRLGKPNLTERHKLNRFEFAKKYISWTEEWKNVLFSDEKKFNLDGPDGWQYYWHDLRKAPDVKMSRNFGGGSLMVWGAFSFKGKLPLAWITTKMKSEDYVEMLEISLIEHGEALMGPDFVFQQDNAAIHNSKLAKAWFSDRNIEVLEWPACSPDLNPIENLWSILARRVYENGKQFDNVNMLKRRIRECWQQIDQETMEKLILSMKSRLIEVIRNNGSYTHY